MNDPRLIQRVALVVALDYGQFYLHTADNDPDLAVSLLDEALDGDGIAEADGLVVVESPHQNNFEMPLTVEVWDRQPADDLDDWQEAFEAHLEVTGQLVYESPTVEVTEIDMPPGSYHALITGRGFVTHGWPGDTEPGDEWRIRLWPSPGPEKARRLRAFREPVDEAAKADNARGAEAAKEERAERGRLAGMRIRADLDRAPSARTLSGQLGAAVIDTVVPGMIARYWFLAANPNLTGTRGGAEAAVGNSFAMYAVGDEDEDEDAIAGTNGEIHCQWTELDAPRSVAMTLQWLGPEGNAFVSDKDAYERMLSGAPVPRKVARLARPSTLRVRFADATTRTGEPVTRIHLEHDNVPTEWVDDLVDFWKSKTDVWQANYAPAWRGQDR